MNPGLGLAGAVVAALASTALALRAGARLPRPPWAEVSLVAVLGVLAAQWVAPVPEEQPVLVALSMVAWLGFLMVYPTGRAEPPWLAGIVVVACCLVVGPLVWPAWAQWSAACFIVAFGAGAAGQVWRYQRRSSVRERQATKWLLLGLIPAVGVFLGVGLISFLPATGEGVLTHPWYLAAATAGMWAVPLAATAGLVLGERGPVDRLVVAVVTITGATLLVAVAYVGVLSVGAEPGWATTAACLAVLPAAWMSHAAGSRLAYARGPERPLGRLAAALAHAATPEGVSQVVVTTTRDALNVTSVIIGVDGRPVASIGNPAACTEEELVSFQGEQVAVLAVEPRPGESRLSPRDRTILRSIAQTVAPALYGARSAQRATEAAEQLSAAREDERRRLHADLHDDLGPTLAGLGHIAAAAASAVDADPIGARSLLGRIESEAHATAGRVRQLAYDLRPPELDRLGLEGLLAERLSTHGPGLRVALHSTLGHTPLDEAVQVATLRIVQEAVTNVRRHALAGTCTVDLQLGEDELVITVADDGVGPRHRGRDGIGLASIAQRATELGGRSHFGPGPIGSILRVTLPTTGGSGA